MGNLQPFELEFSTVTDLSGDNLWKINPTDLSEIENLSSILPASVSGIQLTERSVRELESGYFILNRGIERFLAFRPGRQTSGTFISLPIENSTGKNLDRIRISFLFAYHNAGERPITLKLVNKGVKGSEMQPDPADAEERIFNSGNFSGVSDEWQTAGLNLLLEDLMLEDGEVLELQIHWNTLPGEGVVDAFALQHFELEPEEYQYAHSFTPGDLAITEILPSYRMNGENLQYFEIYNRTPEQVDLRGLQIQSGGSEYLIRRPFRIAPYGMVVVGNRGNSEDGFEMDYEIEDLYIPSHGGLIDLVYDDVRIVRAAYDERREGAAWELRSVLAADDGYISLSEFQSSAIRMQHQLYGSPGLPGVTERIYTYVPEPYSSWHLMSSPGYLLQRGMNTEGSGELYFQQENRSMEQAGSGRSFQPGSGFLARGTERADVKPLMAREQNLQGDVGIRTNLVLSESGWQILGNPFIRTMDLRQLSPVNGEFASRVGQIWDPERKTFRLSTLQNHKINPWQGFLIQNRDAESVHFRNESSQEREVDKQERYIALELRGSTEQNRQFTDEAAVLYFHKEAKAGADPFDSEKLWPFFRLERTTPEAALLYFLRDQPSRQQFLAQEARPLNPEAAFEVRLGQTTLNMGGTFTISWPELKNIPDLWTLTLVDHVTGVSVDMRQENSYRFESNSYRPEEYDFSEEAGIHPVTQLPSDHRFSIQVNPDPMKTASEESEGEEQPDKVELYQNFPNPFNPTTNIKFYLPEQRHVNVGVYNIVGQRVALLLDEPLQQGEHILTWDATEMPSGIYIVQLELGSRVLTRKMTLIK